jgi:hypothetical protein
LIKPCDAPLNCKRMADREAEAFGIKPHRAIEIRGPQGDVMKTKTSAGIARSEPMSQLAAAIDLADSRSRLR